MAKKKKKQIKTPEKKERKPRSIRLLLILILNTVLALGLYELGNYFEFYPTFWIYFALALGFSLAYLIYNRGLSRDKITPEMLPPDWSAEKKCEFFAERDKRKNNSKWMLTIIIPLFVTLAFDMVNLYFIDTLKGFFKG